MRKIAPTKTEQALKRWRQLEHDFPEWLAPVSGYWASGFGTNGFGETTEERLKTRLWGLGISQRRMFLTGVAAVGRVLPLFKIVTPIPDLWGQCARSLAYIEECGDKPSTKLRLRFSNALNNFTWRDRAHEAIATLRHEYGPGDHNLDAVRQILYLIELLFSTFPDRYHSWAAAHSLVFWHIGHIARQGDHSRKGLAQLLTLAIPSQTTWDPEWSTSTARGLAQGIYDEWAYDRLPILADALEEAGCDDEFVLRVCREIAPAACYRGMWFLDQARGVYDDRVKGLFGGDSDGAERD